MNGETEIKNYVLPKPARLVLHFEMQNGRPVPSTAPVVSSLGVRSAAVPAAAAPVAANANDLGMYWDNGLLFVKMYGTVDPLNQTVTVESPNVGTYQIRALSAPPASFSTPPTWPAA